MLFLIIFLGILSIVIFGLAFYFLLDNDDYGGFWVLLSLSAGICVIFGFTTDAYNEPHHGCSPTLYDITNNEAYMDMTMVVNHNDTTYMYEIKWKDEVEK